ncbi:hypothetical protein [Paraburkholderia sp. JPY419]|uniref:hypothetical protein n=1 Tax=Paraburkholderia sp. JPY419 TaxID=667660 RepID=UPI003D219DE8
MRTRDERIDEVAATLRVWAADEGFDHDTLFDEFSERATARALRVSPSTLSRWYWEGTGPIRPARVLNGRRWYSITQIAALLVDGEIGAAN